MNIDRNYTWSRADVYKSVLLDNVGKIRNAGYLINFCADGADSYKVIEHGSKNDMQTVQGGIVIFVGTWEEMKSFISGMVFILENAND